MLRNMVLISALIIGLPTSSSAQTSPVEGGVKGILSAAAEYVSDEVLEYFDGEGGARIIIDPAVIVGTDGRLGSAAGSWELSGLQDVANRAGARIRSGSDYLECEEPTWLDRCSLENADALVNLGSPRIQGDTATVWIQIYRRAPRFPDPTRAFRTDMVLNLSRTTSGEWQVAGIDRIGVS